MIGRDVDASPTQYRSWIVEGEPDFTGEFYTGLKSGDRPLVDVSAYLIEENAVDYNFPIVAFNNFVNWKAVQNLLPESIYDSQLVVLDGYYDGYGDGYIDGNGDGYLDGYADGYVDPGYVYLFGGKKSNKIYRAKLSNPAEWEDTEGYLPSELSSSHLAIIGSRIYLFGGENNEILDTIYSASVFSPLDWTNHGSLLPYKIKKSQLAIIDNEIYLFGGYTPSGPSNVILKASTDDPLNWIDFGATLPEPLYSSHLGIVGDRVYLFGGKNLSQNQTNIIVTASLADLTNWSYLGTLPNTVSDGHFFTVGSQGYIIAPGIITPYDYQTKILRCNLATPTQWVNTKKSIPGNISEFQFAIIYDRVFLYGGNGSSIIYASNYFTKYSLTDAVIVSYGDITRTQFQNTTNKLDLFKLLGFPDWKTNY
jgi:hypothetical protein